LQRYARCVRDNLGVNFAALDSEDSFISLPATIAEPNTPRLSTSISHVRKRRRSLHFGDAVLIFAI